MTPKGKWFVEVFIDGIWGRVSAPESPRRRGERAYSIYKEGFAGSIRLVKDVTTTYIEDERPVYPKDQTKDVHTEHCCAIHGCKYGDSYCPVEKGKKPQSYLCESCHDMEER